jgi:hypothetical protein
MVDKEATYATILERYPELRILSPGLALDVACYWDTMDDISLRWHRQVFAMRTPAKARQYAIYSQQLTRRLTKSAERRRERTARGDG